MTTADTATMYPTHPKVHLSLLSSFTFSGCGTHYIAARAVAALCMSKTRLILGETWFNVSEALISIGVSVSQ
jgi:hypothetical protein